MIIKLVRHGQSQANVSGSSQPPRADHLVPLTPLGFEQAREAGRTNGSSFLKSTLIYRKGRAQSSYFKIGDECALRGF